MLRVRGITNPLIALHTSFTNERPSRDPAARPKGAAVPRPRPTPEGSGRHETMGGRHGVRHECFDRGAQAAGSSPPASSSRDDRFLLEAGAMRLGTLFAFASVVALASSGALACSSSTNPSGFAGPGG